MQIKLISLVVLFFLALPLYAVSYTPTEIISNWTHNVSPMGSNASS